MMPLPVGSGSLFSVRYLRCISPCCGMSSCRVVLFILAVSFWLLGRKAEKVWNLEFLRDPKKLNDDMN